jgi:hypothetical protein
MNTVWENVMHDFLSQVDWQYTSYVALLEGNDPQNSVDVLSESQLILYRNLGLQRRLPFFDSVWTQQTNNTFIQFMKYESRLLASMEKELEEIGEISAENLLRSAVVQEVWMSFADSMEQNKLRKLGSYRNVPFRTHTWRRIWSEMVSAVSEHELVPLY